MGLDMRDYLAIPSDTPSAEVKSVSNDNKDFELQVLERLSRMERAVTSQVSQLQTSVTALGSKVEKIASTPVDKDPEATFLTGLTPDVPEEPKQPPIHEDLKKFSVENIVRTHLFNRLHNKKFVSRGRTELVPEELRGSVKKGVTRLSPGEQLGLFEDYITSYLRKKKFDNRPFKKNYPNANFKAMAPFFSNATRSLNKIINVGI